MSLCPPTDPTDMRARAHVAPVGVLVLARARAIDVLACAHARAADRWRAQADVFAMAEGLGLIGAIEAETLRACCAGPAAIDCAPPPARAG
jgi:hypothetical protein